MKQIDLTQHQFKPSKPVVIPLSRFKLRKLALQETLSWNVDKANDTQPDYQPAEDMTKGALIIEKIAPHRFGKYLKPLGNNARFDLCLVQWEGRARPEISSLFLIERQQMQLRLF